MSSTTNHYQVLGVDISADATAIKKAYRRIALTNHPDKTSGLSAVEIEARTKVFKLANTAHEVLTDPTRRARYDLTLPHSARAASASAGQAQRPPQPSRNTPGSAFNFNEYVSTPQGPSNPPPPSPSQAPPQPPSPYQRATPEQRPFGPSAPVPPEENPFLRGWKPSQTFGSASPPRAPVAHPFTAGQRPSLWILSPAERWFYAPVEETAERTTLSFSNHDGWDFSIGVSKKFKWVIKPSLPLTTDDTTSAITVHITMERGPRTTATSLLKDVVINLRQSARNKHARLSCTFIESRTSQIGLAIQFVLSPDDQRGALASYSRSWTWSTDVDQGFLMPFYNELRVSHIMYFPLYPQNAFAKYSIVPEREPYPKDSPHEALRRRYAGMKFAKLLRMFYCREEVCAGKKFWRLVAVGSV
ncbi:hypothetical protein J1614_004131 [Plenodomus biglobosus]|nr:hypothetical protein J1614_004131 [Plenodomus biglobosus]